MPSKESKITLPFDEKEPTLSASSCEDQIIKRDQLESLLSQKDEAMPEALNRLIEDLKEQYEDRLETMQYYGILPKKDDADEQYAPFPTCASALNSFSEEELEVARSFMNPVLLLVPENSFMAKVRALNSGKHLILYDETFVDYHFMDLDTESEGIAGWRPVIVEGYDPSTDEPTDDAGLRFDERIRAKKEERKACEKGMDRHKYAMLMLESIKSGEPIDQNSFTILDDDEALSREGVPYACFDKGYHEADFYWGSPGRIDPRARFRSSVGGDKIIS